ncbi:MAG: TonB-dependent receptor [Bacteroidales bacterium]|nr:TonB-dependent receptor [Bacteroidales bacterium]
MTGRNLIILLILLVVTIKGYGQQPRLLVTDARTSNPIAFAHVVFESAANQSIGAMTDINGYVDNPSREPMIIMISYVGYSPLSDTVYPGESRTILLQPVVYNIDEVVVTGQYTPQRVDKSIYKVKIIGSRQIDLKAANNLSDLMAGELNIRASHDGALGSSITLQGLGGEHIKYLIDGVPVIGRMNGNIDLTQLNLHNVEHIEVIEGPMSVIYGSNALAGVINIITRKDRPSSYSLYADSYYESVGIYNFSLEGAMKKKRWSGTLGGARNFFEGYSLADTSRTKRWKPKEQYYADGGVQYSYGELTARLTTSYFNELLLDRGNPVKPYYESAFDSYFYTNRFTTNLDLNTRLFKDRYLSVLASQAYYGRIKNTYFKDLTTLEETLIPDNEVQDTSRFNQYLMRATFSKSTEKSPFNYQLGVDLNYENGSGKRILDQKQAIGDYAAFLSVKLQPAKTILFQPGVRYSYNTKYSAPLVYSLNLKYDLFESINLRASYSKGFRAPSLKELYLEFVDVNHNVRGNENLKAENSQNINLSFGYQHVKPTYDWGFDVSVFYNDIKNSITLAAIDWEEGLYTYVNLSNMITKGYQVSFNNRIYPWLQTRFGVGTTGRNQFVDQQSDRGFTYSTDFVSSANYLWQKTGITTSVYYKYQGEYPEVFIGPNSQVLSTTMSAYHTLDITLSRGFWSNRLNAQVGAKNLFNNTNIAISGDTGGGGIHSGGGTSAPVGWGRTFTANISLALNKF